MAEEASLSTYGGGNAEVGVGAATTSTASVRSLSATVRQAAANAFASVVPPDVTRMLVLLSAAQSELGAPTPSPFTLLYLLQNPHWAGKKEELEDQDPPGVPGQLPLDAAHWVRLAVASYKTDQRRLLSLTAPSNFTHNDIMFHFPHSRASDCLPAHVLLRDRDAKAYVLAVRGTDSLWGLVSDLAASVVDLDKGYTVLSARSQARGSKAKKGKKTPSTSRVDTSHASVLSLDVDDDDAPAGPPITHGAHAGLLLCASAFLSDAYATDVTPSVERSLAIWRAGDVAAAEKAGEAPPPPPIPFAACLAAATSLGLHGLPAVLHALFSCVPECVLENGWRCVLVGHSLGGGVATLLCARMRQAYSTALRPDSPLFKSPLLEARLTAVLASPLPVFAVVVAPPSCVTPDLSSVLSCTPSGARALMGAGCDLPTDPSPLWDRRPLVTSLILGEDVVPRLSIPALTVACEELADPKLGEAAKSAGANASALLSAAVLNASTPLRTAVSSAAAATVGALHAGGATLLGAPQWGSLVAALGAAADTAAGHAATAGAVASAAGKVVSSSAASLVARAGSASPSSVVVSSNTTVSLSRSSFGLPTSLRSWSSSTTAAISAASGKVLQSFTGGAGAVAATTMPPPVLAVAVEEEDVEAIPLALEVREEDEEEEGPLAVGEAGRAEAESAVLTAALAQAGLGGDVPAAEPRQGGVSASVADRLLAAASQDPALPPPTGAVWAVGTPWAVGGATLSARAGQFRADTCAPDQMLVPPGILLQFVRVGAPPIDDASSPPVRSSASTLIPVSQKVAAARTNIAYLRLREVPPRVFARVSLSAFMLDDHDRHDMATVVHAWLAGGGGRG